MENNTLKSGSQLKNGEYSIVRVLGQGGFGITYEGQQNNLKRRVAIKEFFMKDSCQRDEYSSKVTVPTVSNRELVERFKQKFIREAQMIAGFDNEHIVKIYDVFEENGTAYYVMEFLGGGSLSDLIKSKGQLTEQEALRYVNKIADALKYLHKSNVLHFDVKPSNILFGEDDKLKLIDFGISKHFDEGGHQTSSTPIGISKGFAPLEQYQQEDVASFSPATDIYALGATLFNMLTGSMPPEASAVMNNGLPAMPGVSKTLAAAIEKAMSPRKKDRPQSVEAFLGLFEVNTISEGTKAEEDETQVEETIIIDAPKRKFPKWLWGVVSAAVVIILCIIFWPKPKGNATEVPVQQTEEEQPQPLKEEPAKHAVIALQKIELSKTSLTLEEGKTVSLTVKYTPSNTTDRTTTWESANQSVAKVDKSGKVTAITVGNAKIIAKCGTLTAYCNVTVTAKQVSNSAKAVKPYIENGVNLGSGIAVLGDWNGDGRQTTLYWAPVNCGYEEKGKVNSDSDHRLGKLYQWGAGDSSLPYYYEGRKVVAREMYYDTRTPSPWYHYNVLDGTTSDKWSNNQGPCPKGWRLPTSEEFEVLCAGKNGEYGWVSDGSCPGAEFFGANRDKTPGKGVFFPAAGCRDLDGYASGRGSYGFYWASTPSPDCTISAYDLRFNSSGLCPQYDIIRAFACPVRCVSE